LLDAVGHARLRQLRRNTHLALLLAGDGIARVSEQVVDDLAQLGGIALYGGQALPQADVEIQ